MKTKEVTIQKILRLNNLITKHHIKGNDIRKRFYQSLMSWVISKELKNN